MAWSGLTLTVDGRQALTDAQMSNVINFKAIVIGDGAPPTNFNTQKSLVHQLYEITDIDVEASEEGCTITGDFPIVDYDYYFKETGRRSKDQRIKERDGRAGTGNPRIRRC